MIKNREYRYPINCSINVTGRCNLSCLHCSADSKQICSNDMTTDQLSDVVLSLINDAHVFKIQITGGEPLMRDDIFKILSLLKENCIPVTFFTNATLVTDEIAQRLANETSIVEIMTSLDGATSQSHDGLRGKGAFKKTLNGVSALLRAGLEVGGNCIINKLNMNELPEIVKVSKEAGLSGTGFNIVGFVGRARENASLFNFTKQELDKIYDTINMILKTSSNVSAGEVFSWPKEVALKCKNNPVSKKIKALLSSCGICRESVVITHDGWMVPCNKFWDYKLGNVLERSILEVYNSENAQKIRNLAKLTCNQLDGCADCMYVGDCGGGCRADAFATSKSLTGIDKFRCIKHYTKLGPNDYVFFMENNVY